MEETRMQRFLGGAAALIVMPFWAVTVRLLSIGTSSPVPAAPARGPLPQTTPILSQTTPMPSAATDVASLRKLGEHLRETGVVRERDAHEVR
jgi:hypothetical protein